MPEEIVVETGARLHFGLMLRSSESTRQFGSVGCMIDAPGVRIAITRPTADASADEPAVEGESRAAVRLAEGIVEHYRTSLPAAAEVPPFRLKILRTISSHHGLGSGTQLSMAIASGLARWSGEFDLSTEELARRAGRGRRSAIGVHGFARGGWIVDGGRREEDAISPLVSRLVVPDAWRWVLISLRGGEGISGLAEHAAFSRLAPMPPRLLDQLGGMLVWELLPAIVNADFTAASQALFEFGRLTGEHFAQVQRGTFAHPAASALVQRLHHLGVRGVGQTSWGPTLFALTASERDARWLYDELKSDAADLVAQVDIARPLNRGAIITT